MGASHFWLVTQIICGVDFRLRHRHTLSIPSQLWENVKGLRAQTCHQQCLCPKKLDQELVYQWYQPLLGRTLEKCRRRRKDKVEQFSAALLFCVMTVRNSESSTDDMQ